VTDDYVVTHNTAFALNIAKNAGVVLRRKVLTLSLEMSKEQLVQTAALLRGQGRLAEGPHRLPRAARLAPTDDAAGRLADAPIFIDDTPALFGPRGPGEGPPHEPSTGSTWW